MNLGKTLRLRRIFSSGRALVADGNALSCDAPNRIRLLAREGADAVVLTPGQLQQVSEDLDTLAVILRLDAGPGRPRLLSVEAALDMGAEAVLAELSADSRDSLANFAASAEDARRRGMPLVAHILDEDWREGASLAAGFGADLIETALGAEAADLREFVHATGAQVLVRVEDYRPPNQAFAERLYDALQNAARGFVLAHRDLAGGALLDTLHSLVHQGITAAQAATMLKAAHAERGNSR
ncbi:MAG TPA: hypothetical protein VN428_18485 [Bryobacteraceae bacterium]|nr:hypothetical protein [Bryobacteraceae bacterium]